MNSTSIKSMCSKLVALAIAAGAVLPITAHAESQLKPKALVVMLDGWRADTVSNGFTPNIKALADGKWQPGYKAAWSLSASTIRDGTTESAPNHVAHVRLQLQGQGIQLPRLFAELRAHRQEAPRPRRVQPRFR